MKKRLRRKYHTDEFTEIGFVVQATLNGSGEDEVDRFLGAFIDHLDQHRLYAGGYCSNKEAEFFVQKDGVRPGAWRRHEMGQRASTTDEDRAVVERWLKQQPQLKSFQVGALQDAWYE